VLATAYNRGTATWLPLRQRANQHEFYCDGVEKARLDSSGNLGLGVAPSAWDSNRRVFQVGGSGAAWASSSGAGTLFLSNNAYFDGSNFKYLNTSSASYLAQQTDGSFTFNQAASGTAGNAISFTTAMVLDASGNLGVGTTSISARGHFVSAPGTVQIKWSDATNGTANLDTASGLSRIWTNVGLAFGTGSESFSERARITSGGNFMLTSGGQIELNVSTLSSKGAIAAFNVDSTSGGLVFKTESSGTLTERARITSDGSFLVNTTSNGPAAKMGVLTPNGGNGIYVTNTSGSSSYNAMAFYVDGTTYTNVGSITCSGSTTAYNTSSDRRLKDNISPADNTGAVIDAIEVVKHDWKVGGHTRYGMIAQDLYMVAPEAVSVGDADDVEELKRPWGVDYSKLVPILVKEVQSLRKRVAELEAK
jgi:hypothetical protein